MRHILVDARKSVDLNPYAGFFVNLSADAFLEGPVQFEDAAEWLGGMPTRPFTLQTYTHLMPSSDERTKNVITGLYGRKKPDGPATASADEKRIQCPLKCPF